MNEQTSDLNERLRRLPAVEVLTTHPALTAAIAAYAQPLVVDVAREVLDQARSAIQGGAEAPADSKLINSILLLLPERFGEPLRMVINGTGILIHTNLGRAPQAGIPGAPGGYTNLEYDLAAGQRGKRGRLVEAKIARLAGAEAALVVNNNAAAVYLVLSSLAANKEVIISRGELVQIGGGFRIPEILIRAGAKLREVGTTNRTSIDDYQQGINSQTALILKVHRSNFRMTGFVSEADLVELGKLGQKKNILLIMDLGSGAVSDVRPYGLPREPTLADVINDGADLVCASGDKLFGGPQAGLIAGRGSLIKQLRIDPFYRALRPDKTALAGLEFTARAHLDGEAGERLPLYRMLAVGLDKLRQRAESLMLRLREDNIDCRVINTQAMVGGGSLPEEGFASIGLQIKPSGKAVHFTDKLRANDPPVIGMITEDVFRLDLRTIFIEQDEQLVQAIIAAHKTGFPLSRE